MLMNDTFVRRMAIDHRLRAHVAGRERPADDGAQAHHR
jgi:hypothetical protein